MSPNLRPMTLGEILDRTFQILREKFWSFVCIASVPAALMAALHLADHYWWHLNRMVERTEAAQVFVWALIQSIGYHHAAILIYALFTPAMVHLTSGALFGDKTSPRSSLRFSFSRWRSFLWIGVLTLSVLLVTEVAAVGLLTGMGYSMDAMGLLNDDSGGYINLLIFTPFVGGGLLYTWLSACCAFMVPACAFEEKRGFKAVRRSWTLSREGRWRIAGASVLIFLLSWVMLLGVQAVFRWAIILIFRTWPGSRHLIEVVYQPGTAVIQAMVAVALRPLYSIVHTLFYYDQRIRKEGFDIEWMMQSAGMTEGALEPAVASIPVATVPVASGQVASGPVASVQVEDGGA